MRTEVIGNCRLYLGDMRELLPTLGLFDACVTDPPYGIDYGKAGGFSASHGWGQWRENVKWDQSRPEEAVFKLLLSCSKEQVIWGGNYFTDYLPPTMRWLIWDKGQRDFSLADFEMAWCSQYKAARIFTYARGAANQEEKLHPTQKPVELIRWCLDMLSKPKSVVDPFSGSGTTLAACMSRGIAGVGIEQDETYFDASCRRLEKVHKQPDMFIEAEKLAEQLSLLSPEEAFDRAVKKGLFAGLNATKPA